MGQSLVKNYIHIIFSTKRRVKYILPEIENELYAYLGGICKHNNCPVLKVGGHLDHVHILCMLSKNITLSKLVEEIKAHSSKWIKTKGIKYRNFYWQTGFGAFSVGHEKVEGIIKYIANQKKHHEKKVFEDEFRIYLNESDVEFDERYVWD